MKRWTTSLLLVAAVFTGAMFGAGIAVYLHPAIASRNSAGTYSLATSPVTTLQTISTSLWNNTFSDLAVSMTDSLDRNGRGGMLAALRGIDGTVAAPAFSYTSETGSGEYRIGAGDLGLSILGTKTGEWTANGYRSADGAVATPSLSFFNDTGSGFYRIGSNDIGFAINGTKKLEWTASLFTVTPNTTISGVASFGGALPTTSNTTPFSVIGAGPLFAVESRSGVNTRLSSNEYFDGATDKYNATGFAGILQLAGLTSADYIFYTAPSGTAGNTPTFTARMTVNESGIQGNGGSTITAWSHGGCTLNGASPAVCTATIVSGQICGVSYAGTTAAPTNGIRASNSAGTVTFTGVNGQTDGINYVCF